MDALRWRRGAPHGDPEDMLILAIVLITAALVSYTSGVWLEHRSGRLAPLHAALFATGLTFDASGTGLMLTMAGTGAAPRADGVASVLMSVMAITGAIALALMALHLLWAVIVLIRNRPNEITTFHRFSVIVWAIWLVPYVTGMLGSML